MKVIISLNKETKPNQLTKLKHPRQILVNTEPKYRPGTLQEKICEESNL